MQFLLIECIDCEQELVIRSILSRCGVKARAEFVDN